VAQPHAHDHVMAAIAMIFWVNSRYPALLKRYHAGTQIKATGALTFGAVYKVDRSMPYPTRVWRTTINWLDAGDIGPANRIPDAQYCD
jgi:hypothetical protein